MEPLDYPVHVFVCLGAVAASRFCVDDVSTVSPLSSSGVILWYMSLLTHQAHLPIHHSQRRQQRDFGK